MSPFWQWFFAIIGLAGFIIGLGAFLMAFPYILQLFFGQPKVSVAFRHFDNESEGRRITIHLMNPPIDNRLLKTFRVSRLPAQSVSLSVTVINVSTKQPIAESFAPEIDTFQSKSVRAALPPSSMLANITLAQWQRSTNSAVLLVGHQFIPLKEGKYLVYVQAHWDGETKIWKPFLLHVGKTESEMFWNPKFTDTIFT